MSGYVYLNLGITDSFDRGFACGRIERYLDNKFGNVKTTITPVIFTQDKYTHPQLDISDKEELEKWIKYHPWK